MLKKNFYELVSTQHLNFENLQRGVCVIFTNIAGHFELPMGLLINLVL